MNSILLKLLFILSIIGCGPSEFGYVGVTDKNIPTDEASTVAQEQGNPGLFSFEAAPNPARPNQSIVFTAECKREGNVTIAWDFGDQSKVEMGRIVRHSYASEGQYVVKATCKSEGQSTLEASATLTVSQEKGPNQN